MLNFLIFVLTSVSCFALDLKQDKQKLNRVLDFNNGYVEISAKINGSGDLRIGQYMMFIRTQKDEFEVLARGQVVGTKDDRILLELSRDGVLKLPRKGDHAVLLEPPKNWEKPDSKTVIAPSLGMDEVPIPPEPGYIEFGIESPQSGEMQSTGSTLANEYKDSPAYQPSAFYLRWYFEFLWRFGFEFHDQKTAFPTETYAHESFDSKESIKRFSVLFRTRKLWGDHLRATFSLNTYTNDFKTENRDENLISSLYQASGLGFRLSEEFNSSVWTTESYNPFALGDVFLQFVYYPSVEGQDQLISRGTGTPGSKLTELALGASALMYLKWMPWFKRYVINISYHESLTTLQFSGPTLSETGGIYKIPEAGSSTEKRSYITIGIAIRFEDGIGKFLTPR